MTRALMCAYSAPWLDRPDACFRRGIQKPLEKNGGMLVLCPKCGAAVDDTLQTCTSCGAQLNPSNPTQPEPIGSVSPFRKFHGGYLMLAALALVALIVELITLKAKLATVGNESITVKILLQGVSPALYTVALVSMLLALAVIFLQLVQAIPWNKIISYVVLLLCLVPIAIVILVPSAYAKMLGVTLGFGDFFKSLGNLMTASVGSFFFVLFAAVLAVLAVFKALNITKYNPGKLPEFDSLEFLRLSKGKKRNYKVGERFSKIPGQLWNLLKSIGRFFKNAVLGVGHTFKDLFRTFKNGDYKTRLSYVFMGFGNIARGQVLRGVLFLLFEAVFIFYMVTTGIKWLSMLPSLGKVGPHEVYHEVTDTFTTEYGDNSFKILLYGVLTIFFIIAFIYTWRQNIKQNKIAEEILRTGKPLKSGKDDLHSLVDDQFHKTLLALPLTGILIFTVMPIVFMILVAFTNYSGINDGYYNSLFKWVGLDNFNEMLSWSGGGNVYSATFGEVLTWTLIWAFFATFTNYFLGVFVAMMINKKGIVFKKAWRTILVLTIAIPQFISLLYVSKMFDKNGIINGVLMDLHIIDKAIDFWGSTAHNALLPRVMVIIINIWIGIPYLMLIATGILMNIPADLYESAKIDGASGWKQFSKITLPYMLFITGPYLLTSFTGNMNNFNVIYLLTGGNPINPNASSASGSVGYTDLLITWLFKITTGAGAKYYMASVIGILVFVVVAVISLVVYNVLPSIKNEEDFQ